MSRVLGEATAGAGRVIVADLMGQGDYQTIQAAIDAAQAESPSNTEQWLVLVAPGLYAETLTLRDYVNVAGFAPGPSAIVKPSGASAIAAAAECTLSNLALSGDSSPVMGTGAGFTGKLKLRDVVVEDDVYAISPLWVQAGEVEIRNSLLQGASVAVYHYGGTLKIFNSILRIHHDIVSPFFYYPAMYVSGGTVEVYHSLIENTTQYGPGVEILSAPTLAKFEFCTVRQAGGDDAFKVDTAGNLDTVYLASILANGTVDAKITGLREAITIDSNV